MPTGSFLKTPLRFETAVGTQRRRRRQLRRKQGEAAHIERRDERCSKALNKRPVDSSALADGAILSRNTVKLPVRTASFRVSREVRISTRMLSASGSRTCGPGAAEGFSELDSWRASPGPHG